MKKSALLGFTLLISLFLSQAYSEAAAKLTNVDDIKIGYDDGFVLKVDELFSIRFKAFIQFQHLFEDFDNSANTSTFKVAKGRLRWNGFVYNPNIAYVIQLELANPQTGEDNNVSLKDFLIDIKHYKRAKVRVGQFKVPFNRQQLAFFGDLQFVDTSHASKQFNANQKNARDIGISLSGNRQEHMIEYFVGLFNGNGPNTVNDSSNYLTVLRVVVNPFGKMSISESDLANSENRLLSVGAGIAYDSKNKDGGVGARGSATTLSLEFAFKHRGASVQGEFYARDDDRNPDADGGYLQGGFFIVPKKVEVAGRYSHFDPDGGGNNVSELTGGINFFFAGHRRKLQFDVSSISNDLTAKGDSFRIRSQYQVSF